MKILFSLQLLIRRLAQEVLDEPLGQQGRSKEENKLRNTDYVRPPDTASYILRRLARDGAENAKVRKVLNGGDRKSEVANLRPPVKNKGQARDQAASVFGVSGKMVSDAN